MRSLYKDLYYMGSCYCRFFSKLSNGLFAVKIHILVMHDLPFKHVYMNSWCIITVFKCKTTNIQLIKCLSATKKG